MEPKLITIAQLLLSHSPAVLVRAIDKHGLYGWDEFGIWGEYSKKTETVALALRKLSEVHYARVEAARHEPPKSWHSVLTGSNLIGPLHHLGWLQGQMPNFNKFTKELSGGPVFMPINTPKMRDQTVMSIIGALLEMLKEQPFHDHKIKDVTQAKVIEHLTTRYRDYPGISRSNLENVFSQANLFIVTNGTSATKKLSPKTKATKPP